MVPGRPYASRRKQTLSPPFEKEGDTLRNPRSCEPETDVPGRVIEPPPTGLRQCRVNVIRPSAREARRKPTETPPGNHAPHGSPGAGQAGCTSACMEAGNRNGAAIPYKLHTLPPTARKGEVLESVRTYGERPARRHKATTARNCMDNPRPGWQEASGARREQWFRVFFQLRYGAALRRVPRVHVPGARLEVLPRFQSPRPRFTLGK